CLLLGQRAQARAEAGTARGLRHVELAELRAAPVGRWHDADAADDRASYLGGPEPTAQALEARRDRSELRQLAVHVEHAARILGENAADELDETLGVVIPRAADLYGHRSIR